MEPMLPPEEGQRLIEDAAFDLIAKSSALAGQIWSAIAAAHHRFLWIHPLDDGNGRVARLMSHAMLKRLGVGSSFWSVSRVLARNVGLYN